MKIGYVIAKSPLGKVLVGATERGVSAVYLGDSEAKLLDELRKEYPRAEIAPAAESYGRWVAEIVGRIEGRVAHLEVPLDLQDTARDDADVFAGGAGDGEAQGGAGRGARLRDESGVDCGAVSSGDSGGWKVGGVSVGAGEERRIVGAGIEG